MASVKQGLASATRRAGLVVRRTRSTDPWHLIGRGVGAAPVVFDIGANTGQTAVHSSAQLTEPSVYAFEPSPTTFRELSATVAHLSRVQVFNVGMGAEPGTLTLLENEQSDMSSVYAPARDAWGTVVRETAVDIWTVDGFRAERGLGRIDVLKTDTQGYDLEVLRGADDALSTGAVGFVLTEITFAAMYEGAPRFDRVLTHLLDREFRLVNMYVVHQDGVAKWADALFAHAGVTI